MTAPDILSALDAVEHQGASERIRKYLLGYLQFYIVALADNAEAVLKLLLPCGKKLFKIFELGEISGLDTGQLAILDIDAVVAGTDRR